MTGELVLKVEESENSCTTIKCNVSLDSVELVDRINLVNAVGKSLELTKNIDSSNSQQAMAYKIVLGLSAVSLITGKSYAELSSSYDMEDVIKIGVGTVEEVRKELLMLANCK